MIDCDVDITAELGAAVLAGLSQPQKTLPTRFLYDRRGSELFEQITELPEYYPTRVEIALLEAHAADILRLTGPGRVMIEFGSGSSTKTPLLLSLSEAPIYVPVDVSNEFLAASATALAEAHPDVEVLPIAADFTAPLRLPPLVANRPMLGFFPGSTIGNFSHAAAADLLRRFRETLGPDARLLIGIDLRKNPRLIEAAYDDAAGVSAAFNLNLLHRINRDLDARIPVDAFEHRAVWHDGLGRIEMHLLAVRDLSFEILGHPFRMRAGETIHTENSYKYTLEEARLLARVSGWEPMAAWTDAEHLFSLHLWTAPPDRIEP